MTAGTTVLKHDRWSANRVIGMGVWLESRGFFQVKKVKTIRVDCKIGMRCRLGRAAAICVREAVGELSDFLAKPVFPKIRLPIRHLSLSVSECSGAGVLRWSLLKRRTLWAVELERLAAGERVCPVRISRFSAVF